MGNQASANRDGQKTKKSLKMAENKVRETHSSNPSYNISCQAYSLGYGEYHEQ